MHQQSEVARLEESQHQKDRVIQERDETIQEKDEAIREQDEAIQEKDAQLSRYRQRMQVTSSIILLL